MKTIRERLLERKVVQWLLAYVAGAYFVLELSSIVGEQFNWPAGLQRAITVLLGMGCLLTCVLAWYHGEKGRQRLSGTEVLLIGLVLVAAGFALNALKVTPAPAPPGPGDLTPSPNSIAILFLDAPDGDDDLRAFADQLTVTLIGAFTKFRALDVRSALTVESYRGTAQTVEEIGRSLNVALLVSGRVQRTGDGLLLRVGLTEAHTGRGVWSAPYEAPVGPAGELSLVEAIAPDLSEALRRQLGPEIGRLRSVAGTESYAAWEALTLAGNISRTALDILETGDSETALAKLAEADTLLLEATRQDSRWIEPHLEEARLAERRIVVGWNHYDQDQIRQTLATGLSHVAHAFEIDHTSPDAYYLRGLLIHVSLLRLDDLDPDSSEALASRARADFITAANLDPSLAAAWAKLALLRAQRGEYEEAYEAARKAHEQDAFLMESDQELLTTLAHTSFEAGREEEAVSWCRAGQKGDSNPMFLECELEFRAWGEIIEPLPGLARDLASRIERATAHSPLGPQVAARVRLTLASVLARAGYRGEARGHIDQAAMLAANATPPDPSLSLWEAAARARMGEHEEAVELLGEFLGRLPNAPRHLIEQRRFRLLRGYDPYEALIAEAAL